MFERIRYIGGIQLFLYSKEPLDLAENSGKLELENSEQTANNFKKGIFVLHGRKQLREKFHQTHEEFLQELVEKDMLVIEFDMRNHGRRLVSEIANEGLKSNPNHPVDMYSMLLGSSVDVSLIIDFLPSFGVSVAEFGVLGYSLGGHTCYHVVQDKRIRFMISVVGCGDYETLMSSRNVQLQSLEGIVKERDLLYNSAKFTESFKELLLIYGFKDTLVPRRCNERIVAFLNDQTQSRFEEYEDLEAGHEFSNSMKDCILNWLSKLQ